MLRLGNMTHLLNAMMLLLMMIQTNWPMVALSDFYVSGYERRAGNRYCVILTEHEGKPMAKLHICGLLVDWKKNKRLGRISTVSKGTKPQEPNAYAFPQPDGGLLVFRYHDVAETEDWERSQSGKTYIRYNVKPAIRIRAAIDQTVDESIDVLRDAESIHQRGGVLVEVTHDAEKPKQCLHDEGGTRYRIITPPTLMVQLSRLATYQKYDERKREWVDRVPPDMRSGFKYPDLLGYVRENRRRLVMAALSIPAHFLKANPTISLSGWGGFEGWSKLVRASLVWAGLPDPDNATPDGFRIGTYRFGSTTTIRIRDRIGLGKRRVFIGRLRLGGVYDACQPIVASQADRLQSARRSQ